jgi:phospholipase D1/2
MIYCDMADPESESFSGSDHALGQQAMTNKAFLLHGNLYILVKEAKTFLTRIRFHRITVDIYMVSESNGKHKRLRDRFSKLQMSNPDVVVPLSGAVIGRTFVISNSENPVWMQHFNVPVAHSAVEVHFVVKHSVVRSQIMGSVRIQVETLRSGVKIEGTFPILSDSREPCKASDLLPPVLILSIQYTPVEERHDLYHGVPGTYFPLRRGGKVTLYQDAHVHDHDHDGCLPNLKLDGDVQYEHRDCWHDICEAINQAQRLIYIAGWSVCHMVRLIRDGNGATGCMLGDLLKAKSKKGVRVLLLVWDDPTSISIAGYKTVRN